MQNQEGEQPRNDQLQNSEAISRSSPPTLLRVFADNQDKRSLCIFWVIFFVVIIIITGVSFGLPEEVIYKDNQSQSRDSNLQGCNYPAIFDDNKNLECYNGTDKQGVLMLDLVKQNQFVVVLMNLRVVDSKKELKQLKYKAKVGLHLLQEKEGSGAIYYHQIEKSDALEWQESTLHVHQAIEVYGDDQETIVGYKYPLYAVRDFDDESAVLIMDTDPPLEDLFNVDKARPQIMVVNPEFTGFSIAIRYVYFVLSVLALVLYASRYKKIPIDERILQQKMIFVLSVLLIMFNDPLYPVTVFFPNRASSYFSVFFIVNFVIYLLFLWIMFLDRIFYEDGQKKTQLINWKRILYIIITYILTLVLYTELALDHIEGLPIVATEEIYTNKFIALEVLVLILIVAGFLYILIQYIRICIKVSDKLWRNQLFMFFSIFFLIITLVMFFVNGFHIFDMAGNRILFLFTAMNMYTFYMQYMYSITAEERDRIERGQIANLQQSGGYQGGLLEQASDGDCVDLQFKDMMHPSGPIFAKNRKSEEEDRKNWGGYEMKKEDQQLEEIQSDKQTDFFKERNSEEEERQRKEARGVQKKQNNDFDEFNLD